MRQLRWFLTLVPLSVAVPPAVAAAPDFNREVRPILADKCYHCHGPDVENRKAGLRLDTPSGAARVLRGKSAKETELVRRITTTDAEERMPPADTNFTKHLTPQEVATLIAWVEAGAKYSKHWAYEPPTQAPVPMIPDLPQASPIDRWIRDRLRKEGLPANPRADKATLIRRVTLDLIGLPPTYQEVQAFLNDPSPNAYEKVVDRLLASPRYGERMALFWMDLARYGDSSVYHADGPRDMWGWRDQVIRAFNANMPYDQFTIEQLAGDLIPNATFEQKVASGFNRNHATTDEGGVIPEEFRVDYVVDRVKTVSSTWLAMSMECGQCHDHKYDPISQREYYQFYAYFNNTKDAGMQTRNGNAAPIVEIPDPEAASKIEAAHKARLETVRELANLIQKTLPSKAFQDWLAQQKVPEGTPSWDRLPTFFLPFDEKERATGLTDWFGSAAVAVTGRTQDAKRPGGDGIQMPGNVLFQFADGPQVLHNKPFTFSAWVKIPANGGGYLLTRMESPERNYRGFDFGTDHGAPGFHLIHRWPDDALKIYAKKPLKPDTWHHVVITLDGTGKAAGAKIYVDGELQEVVVHADSLRSDSIANAPLRLGGRTDGGGFNGQVDELACYDVALAPHEVSLARHHPAKRLLAIAPEKRSPRHAELLAQHYLRTQNANYQNRLKALQQKWDAERKVGRGMTSVMVMEDLPPNQMRKTYVLNRGQYDQPRLDQPVQPGVPAILPPLPKDAPANRLGLAQWIVRPDHPLTARVAVNRFWQLFFGEGLVRTSEDFGLQGEAPSHPELLDWLAVDFVKNGWNIKRLVKQIVMSETYCQDSKQSPLLQEKDPENRLLARGPRFRLQAEFIRDQALFVSGLLNDQIGGPSVRTYQPKGIWEEVALDTNLSRFVQDTGSKLYRRSMYIYWKRSAPHPAMTTFDAPSREKCTARRSRTNTPLQALVTLNDPQFVEAARAFAQRIWQQGGTATESRIDFAYRVALSRPATAKEIALLKGLYERQLERFRADPKKANELLKVGESSREESIPADEHAAWTMVASTIMNLDEFLVKN